MASNASRSPSPPSTSPRRRTRGCARRCERACCAIATYFPLAFVYSLTTWACYVDAGIGFHKKRPDEILGYGRKIPSIVGVILYILLNASYTKAVFTDPGSPIGSTSSQKRGKYSVLPTSEPNHDVNDVQTITVSSSGSARYCKKCHVSKPDRAHHCSTCKRCVLKMDHHCPWLATCLGLHNYKAFILFLIYTSLFCWAAFYNSAHWVYAEIFDSSNTNLDQLAPVNVILLSVLSGIIGLVLTGFTSWHLYLCIRGQTTIECLEKTRYLSGVRKVVEQHRQERMSHSNEESEGIAGNLKRARDNILEFHANAVPGAFRFEEGEEHLSPTPSTDQFSQTRLHGATSRQTHHTNPSASTNSSTFSDTPAQRALRSTYNDHESRREHDRYEEYLDEKETSGLPNAFDLGWKKNLYHLFGPNIFLWWLPVCNTTGDGWKWEVSSKWMEAQEEVSRQKEERLRNAQFQQQQNDHQNQISNYQPQLRGGGEYHHHFEDTNNNNRGYHTQETTSTSTPNTHYANSAMSLQTLHYQQKSGRHMRRDFDTTGDDGEIETFEVSGSEADDNDDNDRNDDNEEGGGGGGLDMRKDHSYLYGGNTEGSGGSNNTRPTTSNRNESWGREW